MESTPPHLMNYDVEHSVFITQNYLQCAFIGLLDTIYGISHLYSVSKCIFILEEQGMLKWEALNLILECSKDERVGYTNKTVFCYDFFLNKQE
jgi:hypothetical protein